ncbi:DUF929 domain-containing protein [Picrophilus oshimae]|uniref:Hypothetical exported protein n=1 Tax=Picrophilus torridus (strain ATCC 700027 / DSM 9790 / JCM 10055 / NBRC 100828 / KAW 2/3) TaxID=1122961 RepID=Q6KZG4_PICTO|nr:DUF929 domain-containing protein [Picrophilus oshimae]AAT43888.1 hypothetical exported protein [Picrophilus oshimae DSM 9789]
MANINYKLLVLFIAVFVVIAFFAVDYDLYHASKPECIEINNYCKVSDNDLLKNGSNAIYFITWDKSPIGAADSWAMYELLLRHGININNPYFDNSTSLLQWPGTPALIFNSNYTFTYDKIKVEFYPEYIYNDISNNSNCISSGLNRLKSMVPESIYNVVKTYTTDVLISGTHYTSANFSAIPHINTVIIITGKYGSYIYNGYIIDPDDFINSTSHSTYSPEYVFNLTRNNDFEAANVATASIQSYLAKVI